MSFELETHRMKCYAISSGRNNNRNPVYENFWALVLKDQVEEYEPVHEEKGTFRYSAYKNRWDRMFKWAKGKFPRLTTLIPEPLYENHSVEYTKSSPITINEYNVYTYNSEYI
jgi:hypothetical protein